MAYKVFTNGSTLQASEVNDNLMKQAVATFSNAAARTAAITTPVEGQMTYLEDVNRYDTWTSAAWSPAFGLTLIKSQTIGTAVSTVDITDVFSSTYDAYKIIVSGGVASSDNAYLRIILGITSSGNHNWNLIYNSWGTSGTATLSGSNQGAWQYAGTADTSGLNLDVTLVNPFLTKVTTGTGYFSDNTNGGTAQFRHTALTSYTSFRLSSSATTMTGGTIAVLGYRKA